MTKQYSTSYFSWTIAFLMNLAVIGVIIYAVPLIPRRFSRLGASARKTYETFYQLKMKIKGTLSTIFSLLILLASCDCPVHYKGYVRDSKTEKPIKGAIVTFDKKGYLTDSLGFFEIGYIAGFCPDPEFQIEKQNFKTENIKIELEDNERVYRVRETSKDRHGAPHDNSLNFKIKNDTLHFFLTEKN